MILFRYFSRRFVLSFLGVFGVFFLLNAFLDVVEQLRRFADADTSFINIVGLSLLNIPSALYQLLPLIVVLASIWMFLGLARSSELVITRAAGRSALRSLLAPVTMALLIGGIAVAIFNPIVAATLKEYEARSVNFQNGRASVLTLSDDGLWLRQGDESEQTVIRARSTNLDGTLLRNATFITFEAEGGPVRRIQARFARLNEGAWDMTDAKVWPLGKDILSEAEAESFTSLSIPSTLSADEIRDSFGTPASISVWELPQFIRRLEAAGFSAVRHKVWFQSELALPVFFVAMVLIAACFTMQHQRGRRVGLLVLSAILLSFTLYFIRNFAQILGENGQIPPILASWAPPVAAVGAAIGLLLHLEES